MIVSGRWQVCLEHSPHSTALSLSLVWYLPFYPPHTTFPPQCILCEQLSHISISCSCVLVHRTGPLLYRGTCTNNLYVIVTKLHTESLSLSLSAAGTEREGVACEYSRPCCPETQDQHSTLLTCHKLTLHCISFITQSLAFLVYFV